ncbi:hypothetical protein Glove_67g73 [Diversispora epigaea]|uniref:Uncharacterized protein n=1 Tax=Diversispora epigaea TaxID=1348612 RepID=A0A397JL66_9GLOM|nr:hypothetical protein Glove_67g73 [Diversispora epigaea]
MTNASIRRKTVTTAASENAYRLCLAKTNFVDMYVFIFIFELREITFKESYNVEIACPPPYGCPTDFIDENNKKVTFCEAVEVGPATRSYNRSGQLYGNKKDDEMDIWFIGETHARTKFNLTLWVNKNRYDQEEVLISLNEIKKNSGKWGPGEECRIWKP